MKWYMKMYGGPTDKPHYAWSNSTAIWQLETPPPKRQRVGDDEPKIRTCEQYFNKEGKLCYKGTKQLRKTENLVLNWLMFGFKFSSFGCWVPHLKEFPGIDLRNISKPCPILATSLREYPVKFGFKLVDLYPKLTQTPKGRAPAPADGEVPPAMTSFSEMPDSANCLEFAQLDEVFNYLRRNRHLNIPAHWKQHVPPPK